MTPPAPTLPLSAAFLEMIGCMFIGLIAAAVVLPPVPAPVDYQLGGAYRPAAQVEIVVRDRADRPAPGRYNICYVNAFQTQPGTLSWWKREHPRLLTTIKDPGWPDERLLDISTAPKRRELAKVVRGWFRGCERKGFDAVEADNLDSWQRSGGLISRRDAKDMARRLIRIAHTLDLAIGQKNAAELLGARLGFDYAITEECRRYSECRKFQRRYPLIDIEYRAKYFRAACRAGFASVVLRDVQLRTPGSRGYRFVGCFR